MISPTLSRKHLFFLALVSVVVVSPLLYCIWLNHTPADIDFIFYSTILNLFSDQFWHGDLYPRWLTAANGDLGSPVFLFYGPIPFYIASLLKSLSGIDPTGAYRLVFSCALAIFVSGITAFYWIRTTRYARFATLAAFIYAFVPYKFTYVYLMFALAQLWALAWLPLLMLAAKRLSEGKRVAAPMLAFGYALLIMTHLPTAVIFSAIPVLYVQWMAPPHRKKTLTLQAATALAIGLALSAIYLLPALANKPFVFSEGFLNQKFNYKNNFLHPYFFIGLLTLALPLFVLWKENPHKRLLNHSISREPQFYLVTGAVLLFFTTILSRPLWDMMPPLHYLQFPFRIFASLIPCAVFVALPLIGYSRKRGFLWGIGVGMFLYAALFSHYALFTEGEDTVEALLHSSIITPPEYQTVWMQQEHITGMGLPENPALNAPPINVSEGKGHAELIAADAHEIHLTATIHTPQATVQLRRFYFPGWQSDSANTTITASHALLSVIVPKGVHDVTLRLPGYAGEHEGNMISLLVLIAALGWWMGARRTRLDVENTHNLR